MKGNLICEPNSKVAHVINNSNEAFKEINYKNDGSIVSIEINSKAINKICNDISIEIYKKIKDSHHSYGMPFGNTLNITNAERKGFKIDAEIIPVGYVEYKINSTLTEAGINQTLHRISADFFVEAKCILPFNKTTIKISLPIILSETLIVGNIPEVLFTS